jgi:hypothetical protein
MAFARFMASTAGRLARVVAGLALIGIGLVVGGWGYVLAVVGLVPLLAGILDVCLFAPLFGQAFREREVRAAAR